MKIAAVCSSRSRMDVPGLFREIGGPSHGHYDICTCAKELSLWQKWLFSLHTLLSNFRQHTTGRTRLHQSHFRVGMQRFGARWEPFNQQQRLLSIFRQHRSCQHTGRANPTSPIHFRVGSNVRWEPFNQQQWELSKSAVRSQPLLRPSATLLIKVLIKRYHYFFSLPTNNVTRIIIIKSTRIASRISTVTNSNESQNPHSLHQCGRRHL